MVFQVVINFHNFVLNFFFLIRSTHAFINEQSNLCFFLDFKMLSIRENYPKTKNGSQKQKIDHKNGKHSCGSYPGFTCYY